ncbi:MAG: folylpolyglutamate synthase/dihydrofolate synthase family protein [Vicinamibacterales bacterium]
MTADRSFLFSLEQIGIKLGLDQIRALLTVLDHPEHVFPSILVAGTNGKGSVTAMLERGLRAAGYRTGRYTSPHLLRLEERVAIDGQDVLPATLDRALDEVQRASASLPHPPSFFEATTAMALDIFRRERVDVAVLEVGLGGRLDATNAVTPVATAITMVDFDHEEYLGHTLEAIAREKAGIIKPGTLLVLGDNPPTVDRVVAETCAAAGAPMVRATTSVDYSVRMEQGAAWIERLETPRHAYAPLHLRLNGAHQVSNALLALRLLEELDAERLFQIPESAIRLALEDVTWPARLELRRFHGVDVLLDGAHNPAGARALANHVRDTYGRLLPYVVGAMRDKRVDAMLEALATTASHFFFVAPDSARAARPDQLLAAAARIAPHVAASTADSPLEAIGRAAELGAPVIVAGSLYLVGEVRAQLS